MRVIRSKGLNGYDGGDGGEIGPIVIERGPDTVVEEFTIMTEIGETYDILPISIIDLRPVLSYHRHTQTTCS